MVQKTLKEFLTMIKANWIIWLKLLEPFFIEQARCASLRLRYYASFKYPFLWNSLDRYKSIVTKFLHDRESRLLNLLKKPQWCRFFEVIIKKDIVRVSNLHNSMVWLLTSLSFHRDHVLTDLRFVKKFTQPDFSAKNFTH